MRQRQRLMNIYRMRYEGVLPRRLSSWLLQMRYGHREYHSFVTEPNDGRVFFQ